MIELLLHDSGSCKLTVDGLLNCRVGSYAPFIIRLTNLVKLFPGCRTEQEKQEMENGQKKRENSIEEIENDANSGITIKGILSLVTSNIDESNGKRVIKLGMGDPTAYSSFHTTYVAEQAVIDAVRSNKSNGYAPTVGLLETRKAVADYLSQDFPYELGADDVYLTSGCTRAIDVAFTTLAWPGANILLPRPGFPIYELCASFRNLEVRHFNLIPDKGWEVDLDAVEALTDHNTVAIVIINPGNPCGNVYSHGHLEKIAELAKTLGIIVIADEVYGHLTFGNNPFVPMGIFGSMVPIFTLGSLSKRWMVPGWRLGWFVTCDPNGMFKNPKIIERIKRYFDISSGPATIIQAALPRIFELTEEEFFGKVLDLLKQTANICYEKVNETPCLACPYKPEGSMAVMVKLNLLQLEDISDDIDFAFKLAKEESVIILPGVTVGLKNWIRITFAADPSSLIEGLERINSFCQRHAGDA